MLAFGITAKVSPSDIAKVFSYILPSEIISHLQATGVDISGIVVSNAIFMIIVGAVGILIASIGFIGACCLVKAMLIVVSLKLKCLFFNHLSPAYYCM
jgi:hypothetical protein